MSGRATAVAVAFIVSLGATACDRRVEPYVPPEAEPPAPDRPVRIPALSRPTPQVPDLGGPGRGPAPEPARAQVSGEISGTVTLGEGVESPSGGVLFVIARAPGAGPPLAVKRLAAGPFPVRFSIGQGDVMMPGRRFEGAIRLSARIDLDGNPLSRGEGDLTAELGAALEPGATGVELVLEPAQP